MHQKLPFWSTGQLRIFVVKSTLLGLQGIIYQICRAGTIPITSASRNGEFSELKYDDDIWEEIPNVGFINRFIRDNDVRWCGLLKGKYELSAGQHTLTHLLMHPDEWKEYIKDK